MQIKRTCVNLLAYDRLQVELLEERTLLAAAFPTNFEQYMVELLNYARANPASYAASLGIDLNEGLVANTISASAKQPMAINPYLTDGAAQHSQWMLDVDTFSHTGSGATSPTQRMVAAGYALEGTWSTGENIAYQGTTGTVNVASFTKSLEEGLFVDAGIAGRGHRRNMMNDTFAEVGVGIRTGMYSIYNSVMATQDFAKSGGEMYLTGVAFADTVAVDNFYTPGEGLANISILAIRDGNGQCYSTTTWSSGGYCLELPKGRYSIWATGSTLGSSQFIASMNMGTKNMKRDFKAGMVRVAPEIAVIANDRYIPNNDVTPRIVDNTDFGGTDVSGGTISKAFAVANIGNGTLNLTGTPRVVLSGAHASDFLVMLQPNVSLSGETTSAFTVQFAPSASGLRTATISISSNDGNENPFTFNVVGTGVASAPMMQSFTSGSLLAVPASGSTPSQSSFTLGAFGAQAHGVLVYGLRQTQNVLDRVDLDQSGTVFPLDAIQSAGPQTLQVLRNESLFRI